MGNSFVNLKTVQITADIVALDADGISVAAGVGGNQTMYSGSFSITGGVQDYDLQTILSRFLRKLNEKGSKK